MHTIKHIAGFYNTTNTYHSLLRVYYESMKTITYLHQRFVIKQAISSRSLLSSLFPSLSLDRFSLSLLVLSIFLFKPSFFYPN